MVKGSVYATGILQIEEASNTAGPSQPSFCGTLNSNRCEVNTTAVTLFIEFASDYCIQGFLRLCCVSSHTITLSNRPTCGLSFHRATMPLTTQTAICLIAALLLVGSNGHDCHGQSFSTPIGYTTLSIQPAWQVLSISLPKPSVLEGTILSSNSTPTARIETSLTSSSTVSALVVSKKYFLEVTGPGMPSEAEDVGHRFEVDVVTTVAANNATIYLDSGSSLNTGAVPDLTGLTFLIRPHTTLADVFGGGANPPRLTGATFMEDADEVQFYNDAGTLDAYWLYVNSSVYQWRSGNDPTDLSDHSGLAIPPGTGIIVYRQPRTGTSGLFIPVTCAPRHFASPFERAIISPAILPLSTLHPFSAR